MTAITAAIRVVPVAAEHHADWERLYAGYAAFYGVEQTAAMRARVWEWLHDPAHEVQGLVALEPSGTADQITIDLLNMAPYRALGQGWDQDMIEIDKTKQLIYIIRGGRTLWVMNTTTGAGGSYTEPNQRTPGQMVSGNADTPEGTFSVYSQQPNGWWKGDLGELYRPKFFKGGAAVHGAPKVPNYPASHGCIRVSNPAMDMIWATNLLPMGGRVWIHD